MATRKTVDKIQIKRGSGTTLSDNQNTTVLSEGEPFYHKGAEFVTIGNGKSMMSDLPRLGVGANISLISAGNVSSIQVNGGAISVGEGGKVDVGVGANIVTGGGTSINIGENRAINLGGNVTVQKGFQIKMQDTPATRVSVGAVSVFGGSRNVVSLGEAISVNGGYLTAVGGELNIGADGRQSNFSTCIGYYSSVKGGSREVEGGSVNADYQTVIGCEAVGNHRDTVAIGHGANAWNDSCIAIGGNASTGGRGYVSVAIGANATSNAPKSIALGDDAKANGNDENQIAIGTGAKSYLNDCISIGTGAIAGNSGVATLSKFSGIAIGSWSNAAAEKAISIGDASTSERYAIGIGANSHAQQDCISIGANAGHSYVPGAPIQLNFPKNCICIGGNSLIELNKELGFTENSIALGYSSVAKGSNFVQILESSINAPTLKVGSKTVVPTDSNGCDARIKQNVTDADTAICLADVNRLKVSRFEYKPFVEGIVDKHRTGWMADDVEKVFKNAVYRRDDTFPELDENGEKVYEEIELEDGTKQKVEKRFVIKDVQHLDMTTIGLPTLWGAVQELSKLMTATQERVTELETSVKTLKKENTLLKKKLKELDASTKEEPSIEE